MQLHIFHSKFYSNSLHSNGKKKIINRPKYLANVDWIKWIRYYICMINFTMTACILTKCILHLLAKKRKHEHYQIHITYWRKLLSMLNISPIQFSSPPLPSPSLPTINCNFITVIVHFIFNSNQNAIQYFSI